MRSVEERQEAILSMVEAHYRAGADRDVAEDSLLFLIRDGEGIALVHNAIVAVFGHEGEDS